VLLDINGFQNLLSITGQFQIESNFLLDDINGFSSLQDIGSYVVIEDNTVLNSLIGLSQLQTIGLSLRISFNPALTNIEPLDNLISIGTQCRIFANNSLSDCAIQILCDGGTQIGGIIDIFSNTNGCQNLNEVTMSCFQGANVEVDENSIVLPTQFTSSDTYTLNGVLSSYTIDILDSNGTIVQTLNPTGTEEIIDLTSLPMGLHLLRMMHNTNNNLFLQVNIKE